MPTRTAALIYLAASASADSSLASPRKLNGFPPTLRFRGGSAPQAVVAQAHSGKPPLSKVLEGQLPTEAKLLLGSAGIFLSFSVFAVLQEDVYKKSYGGEFFAFTFFALLIERGINALVGYAGVSIFGKSGLKIPHVDIFQSGISQMLAMAASNEALRYVSYPTQARYAFELGLRLQFQH